MQPLIVTWYIFLVRECLELANKLTVCLEVLFIKTRELSCTQIIRTLIDFLVVNAPVEKLRPSDE
jgi:hypothetical protein